VGPSDPHVLSSTIAPRAAAGQGINFWPPADDTENEAGIGASHVFLDGAAGAVCGRM
jgi:hypothetical protein